MNPEGDLLRLLAAMPFPDRLEMVSLSGWSRGVVYKTVRGAGGGRAWWSRCPTPRSSSHLPAATASAPARCATPGDGRRVRGRGRVAPFAARSRGAGGASCWSASKQSPSSTASPRRSPASPSPLRFRWYRAMPIDAAIALPDGRTIAIVRQGLTSDRTGFGKRIWRLREGPQPAGCPPACARRGASATCARAPGRERGFISFLALERDVATAGARARIWRPPAGTTRLGLDEALSHVRPGGAWPVERPLARRSLPGPLPGLERASRDERMLPALLKPIEKRALDLVSDWPWITHAPPVGALLGVKRSRLSEVLQRLAELGLVFDDTVEGQPPSCPDGSGAGPARPPRPHLRSV